MSFMTPKNQRKPLFLIGNIFIIVFLMILFVAGGKFLNILGRIGKPPLIVEKPGLQQPVSKGPANAPVKNPAYSPDEKLAESWTVSKEIELAQKGSSVEQIISRRFYVPPAYGARGGEPTTSFGGMLNFKYFAGKPYQYFCQALPGKTVKLDIVVPKEYVSPNKDKPNGLRIGVKSVRDNIWNDYYGETSWVNVQHDGLYHFEFKIPDKPVTSANGKVFDPNEIIVLFVEFHLKEGVALATFPSFYITNFQIDGVDMNLADIKWQFIKNGDAQADLFLPVVEEGSTAIYYVGHETQVVMPAVTTKIEAGQNIPAGLDKYFLVVPIKLTPELRSSKGTVALTVREGDKLVTRAKELSDCDREGNLRLAVPIEDFLVRQALQLSTGEASISLDIISNRPHTDRMLPVIIGTSQITNGKFIFFDEVWRERDAEAAAGYRKISVGSPQEIKDQTLTVKKLDKDLSQLDVSIKMAGGINWTSPFYKAELVRPFDHVVNMENIHIEVLVAPRTNTNNLWQKPYRARIGLIDENDKVMFGPNVSLSEGLSSLAYLDVTTTCPVPKGLMMPGFDPKRVKEIVLNIEASNESTAAETIGISFINLRARPIEYLPGANFETFDFSVFKREPQIWQLSSIVKERGFFIGMNYPFPTLPVTQSILEVPQIYPCVGMKPTDPEHLGLASSITKPIAISDFKNMVSSGVALTRIFTLGHLEGVFNWDLTGRDIKGFTEGFENDIDKYAKMSIAEFTAYLNQHQDEIFTMNGANPLGFEEHVVGDFIALLDILEQVEKETGKKLMAVVSLYDFLLGDGVRYEGPLRIYPVGEHPEVVTDPKVKVKAHALIWKLMKILKLDPRFDKYIAAVEIMNEPDNATVLATPEHFPELVNFVGEGLYILKDALGPTVPVTVGFRSWPEDLHYWHTIAEGVDILMPHYWQSLESYNIDAPGLWPLDMPVAKLWEYLGTAPDGRLQGIGEISPAGNLEENFDRIAKAGYNFALVWSYSGHDGHYGRQALDRIAQYERSRAAQKK